ncbi:MAG: hypothetical protein AAFY71_15495 [Bacteroidota bacterium]
MIEIGYIALTLVVAVLLIWAFASGQQKMGTSNSLTNRRTLSVALGISLWLIYAAILGFSGFLQDFSLPPRVALFLIIPMFVFTGVVLYRNRESKMLEAIPLSWPIYFQSFRILVELLLWRSWKIGVVPYHVTFEGFNFDVFVGISAVLMGLAVFQFKWLGQRSLLIWNYLGLFILGTVVATFMTIVFFPAIWGESSSPMSPEFGSFPFVYVAGFLMPTAVFVHIFSLLQLRKRV